MKTRTCSSDVCAKCDARNWKSNHRCAPADAERRRYEQVRWVLVAFCAVTLALAMWVPRPGVLVFPWTAVVALLAVSFWHEQRQARLRMCRHLKAWAGRWHEEHGAAAR